MRREGGGALALSSVAATPPDLILLNLRMEGVDALEVCRHLKTRQATQGIPIILISDLADAKLAVQGLHLGASDYISRPLQAEALLQSVKTHLSLSQATALRRINGQLQAEIAERRRVEHELNRGLDRVGGVRREHQSAGEILARTQQALRMTQAALEQTQRIAGLAMWVWHIQCDRIEWSDEIYTILDIEKTGSPGDVAGAIAQAVHPDDRAAVEKSNADLLHDKRAAPLEYRIVRPDGTVRVVWSEVGEIVLDADGDPAVITGIVQDITRRRQAEQALIDAERKWRTILVNTPQLGITRDPQGKITFANRHFLALTGWQEDEVLGQNWFDMCVPEELRAEVRSAFDATMRDDDSTGFTNYEGVIMTRAGEVRSIAWSNVIMRDADGRIADVTSLGVDLTERKRAEVDRESILAQFREQVRRIEGILDAVPEGVLLIESDGLVLLANPLRRTTSPC